MLEVKSTVHFRPPSSHVAFVLKLIGRLILLQFPGMGLRSKGAVALKSPCGLFKIGYPRRISHGDTFTGSYLEFPLGRHDFGILPDYLDSGVQAGPVMTLCNVPDISSVCSHTTII